MNGYSHSYEYKVDNIDPRLCDALFNKHTYVHTRYTTRDNQSLTP